MFEGFGESIEGLSLLSIWSNMFEKPINGHQQPYKFMVIVELSCCLA